MKKIQEEGVRSQQVDHLIDDSPRALLSGTAKELDPGSWTGAAWLRTGWLTSVEMGLLLVPVNQEETRGRRWFG
ncbi:hypothetical protein SZN_29565 [Streptomyces zinciresistens K42]|uniref:Uncharacterized protein n=1 Tax=Streptomyces zinciresistens K42 TaxID=700597 RepID=G2GK70_9ACTN|nr:hypothetical protein SZN_29565 [Streptomyces zinciresistens K42]